jgi:hypothetical protein
MPDKDDPNKQIPIAPRFFLASSSSEPALPESLGALERRALAASYITGQDNPWFARAFVNRIWYVLMGETFYDSIDDLGPERTPKAAEVLETLAQQWQKGGYDIHWLFRTILNTKAYQRRVRSTANPAGKTAFASNCPSRLRSDQILDALTLVLGLPTDVASIQTSRGGGSPAGKGLGGNPSSGLPGRFKNNFRNLKKTGLAGVEKPGAAMVQGKAAGIDDPRRRFNAVFGVDPSIPNEEVLGTIPQTLFLMNSPMVHNGTQAHPGTVLGEILRMAPHDRAALGALYLRVLSRQPTSREAEICVHYLAKVGNRAQAFEDIYWSLINSTEFITRR